MKNIIIDGYTRVTKRTAFRMYKERKKIYLVPSKVMPNSFCIPAIPIWAAQSPKRWEDRIAEFEKHYCDAEVGRYAAFYVK